jgi:hypothetical protein
VPDHLILGHDTRTDEEVRLRDSHRSHGLWLIGKPGMGKTNLLLQLLLHDIDEGRGLFFLDPYEEVTKDLLWRIDPSLQDKILLFDPTERTHTFCCNPLLCEDPKSLYERNNAFTRTSAILQYLLLERHSDHDVSISRQRKTPGAQLLLANLIPVFIENQGYTLAELPLFLTNQDFRAHLLQNVRYHPEAVRFWKDQFPETEASLIAPVARHLFTEPAVEQVIGNTASTVDFPRFLRDGKIVLVRFSEALSLEHKACISALLFSELLAAVKERRGHRGKLFSVYVEMLHHVPDAKDYPVLFSSADGFGTTSVFVDYELTERMRDTDQIRATISESASLFFQLSEADAWELAPRLVQLDDINSRLELALELVLLPRFTAICKTGEPELGGRVKTRSRKFQILPLPAVEPWGSDLSHKRRQVFLQAIFF